MYYNDNEQHRGVHYMVVKNLKSYKNMSYGTGMPCIAHENEKNLNERDFTPNCFEVISL